MKKLTYKGKDVKVVKDKGRTCVKCIFWLSCIQGFESENFEKENNLKDCTETLVKYLYT